MKKSRYDIEASGLFPLKKAVMGVEKDAIKQALEIAGWNKSAAASILHIDYKTLLTKIRTYGISQ
ncbi:MAG: hypothetical protein A2077_07255 [Nitrospirae bacterium GWC2_46_6]|nr:MAG: hypothetical protein A2077_07255 [Nitrospirae bacterium GWC2_46_6]OGW22275.1 MAG: hypothetical protein A2Z82_10130 [Nitrospirae bacterium GWA2_46_11]OGW23192.1 MAG: hypothetical protein A2X55_09475 [Nitrospirae bacterium GWB2_47_37]